MRRQRAQALVEFAFVAPVFFLMVFGLLDVGRAVQHYNTVAFVARDAARQQELAGTVSLSTCNSMFTVEGCTKTSPPAGKVLVTTAACPSPAVTVTYTFQPIITFVLSAPWVQRVAPGSGTISLSATSVVPLVPGVCSS